MMGPFCRVNAATIEEYRKIVKKNRRITAILSVLGVLLIVGVLIGAAVWDLPLSDHHRGFYLGVGTGILVGGFVLCRRYGKMLCSDEKLRENWVMLSDERNKAISDQAFRATTTFLMVVLYVSAIIGGIWYPELIRGAIVLVALFGSVYIIAYRIIGMKY